MKRVILIVLDSFGIGEMPDAAEFHDQGSNTIKTVSKNPEFYLPNLASIGLFNIDGVDCRESVENIKGAVARMTESSQGKDTTIGHWEIAGVITKQPLPTYPQGFPKEIIEELENAIGRKVLCNKPYSGTEVIKDFGEEHQRTGAPIVYTSADSVFQIAAHEQVILLEELYHICKTARKILHGKHGVGRVIARPFVGEPGNYTRTQNRHDFSLEPPTTMLDILKENNKEVLAVGKINDIFAGKGVTDHIYTKNNDEGIQRTLEYMKRDFEGLIFTNLVDFDMLYGHRNDVAGYARALSRFDEQLPKLLHNLRQEDILMITADHGCDPGTESTDHSREYTPLIAYGYSVTPGNYGTFPTFGCIGETILNYFGLSLGKDNITSIDFMRKE
ncbi:MAG: phosphopentomutase [Lachnospiraceae bacterium]|nr:phosphopentomutase [Lachnospiraceae bacterium]